MHTRQGFYADPIYGGNRDRIGWKVIGFPGPASLNEVHTGRYSTLPGSPRARPQDQGVPRWPISPSPADRGLHHRCRRFRRGRRQGPDRSRRQGRGAGERPVAQAGDLRRRRARQHQPLQSLARPAAQPAHLARDRRRRSAAAKCSARCRRWSAAARSTGRAGCRASPPNDFRLRTVAGDLPGTTLADWPITYDELEPYYVKVEWAFGVSGQAGANRFEGPSSGGYPCPPMPMSRYAQKFHQGLQRARLEFVPDAAGGAVAPVQRPHGDGDQRLRPAARRPDRHALVRAQCFRSGRCGNRPFRAPARLLCARIALDGQGRIKAAVYQDADGDMVEQEADLFILACGAMETARLLLLSKSGRFPNGLANGSDLVGRNVTFHEYSAAVGTYDDPIYAWAGGGYVSASTSSTTSTMQRAASSPAATSPWPVSASRCRSTGACRARRPGAPKPRRSTAIISTIRWRSPWCCTTCRGTTTESTSTTRWSTPGACRWPG